VDRIFASIDALESLFSELLDLSRLDTGHTRPQMQHACLSTILERLRSQYATLAESNGLALTFDDSGATVRTDPVLLQRMLGNLIANAIQFTERGWISVLARRDDDAVVVEVQDTGIGIPQGVQTRVFDEFFQVGNPERDRRKGLGLGLAIVRRLASMLDVAVSLQSTEGHGTCFTLRVPAGDPAQVAPRLEAATPAASPDPLRGKTILVVDDETEVVEGMQELLHTWGCRTLPAADAHEAAAAARRHSPDLIIADLRLRDGRSGIDAIDSVRQALHRDIPAVLITGDIAADALEEAGLRGYPLLHKPVRPVRLRAALSQLLAVESGSRERAQREALQQPGLPPRQERRRIARINRTSQDRQDLLASLAGREVASRKRLINRHPRAGGDPEALE
jgi:CheY-like chemotaxis protein